MIRVYFLPIVTIEGIETVAGIDIIHDALLEATEEPNIRKLIQDTTQYEHDGLVAAGGIYNPATQEEIDRYHTQVIPYVPDPDTLRAKELLSSSPDAITQPEMWELTRIYGRRLGYRFD